MKQFWLLLLLIGCFQKAQADIVNCAGIETGDTSEFFGAAGTIGSTTTFAHHGTYSLRSNPTTNGTGSCRLGSFANTSAQVVTGVNVATGTAGFYWMYQTKPATKDEELYEMLDLSNKIKVALRINSNGNIVLCDNTNVGLATGTTVINAGSWYHFEVLAGSGTSAYYEFRIGGNVELSGTGNLSNAGTDAHQFGKAINRNSQSIDFYYDDIVWSSITYAADGVVGIMLPSANGSGQKFTVGAGAGSHYQLADEIPPDGDTSYLVSTLVLVDSETEKIQTSASAGISGTINFVRLGSTTKEDGASAGSMGTRVIVGTTTVTSGGSYATTVNYVFRTLAFSKNPNSGTGTWTFADLDNMESGVKEGSTVNKSRMTAAYAIVHYTPKMKASFYIR